MKQIEKITIEDKEYPQLLKKISNPPKVLYVKGEIKNNELCFAVVGTRRNSPYGKQVALEIAGELAETGLTIVSGLAPGIDTFSHQACVERGKRTIAVLGTGLDEKSIYPQTNLELSRKIIETGGCLISEYPPGTSGSRFTFPQRNRIISGVSLGVLVIEAKEKSGSLITANYGFRQKRKVFAIPGPIFSSNSKGTHKVIKEGAKLVERADDILEELNLHTRNFPSFGVGVNLKGLTSEVRPESQSGTLEEKLILEVLKEGPLYIDKIIEKTKLNAPVVSTALALMEISGRVRNLGGNTFALSH